MSSKTISNVPASVAARLKNWADENSRSYQHALGRYATERFLARIEASEYADRFVLKGGNLFLVWFSGVDYRPTMDTDFLLRGDSVDEAKIKEMFAEICRLSPSEDGIKFDGNSIETQPIREDAKYGGWRVVLKSYIGTIRIPLQFDIGFGDAVTPEPEKRSYPAILGSVSPQINTYPAATVVAEKCAIMVELGFGNSRMKDFYDVWTILGRFTLPDAILREAIANTFNRRGTPTSGAVPLCFTDSFAKDRKRPFNGGRICARATSKATVR